MAKTLSFPFRIGDYGAAVSVEQGDDRYYKEQIATILLTKAGERPLADTLGMPDIAFRGFQYSAFKAQVNRELPELNNLTATVEELSDATEVVTVTYDVSKEF